MRSRSNQSTDSIDRFIKSPPVSQASLAALNFTPLVSSTCCCLTPAARAPTRDTNLRLPSRWGMTACSMRRRLRHHVHAQATMPTPSCMQQPSFLSFLWFLGSTLRHPTDTPHRSNWHRPLRCTAKHRPPKCARRSGAVGKSRCMEWPCGCCCDQEGPIIFIVATLT